MKRLWMSVAALLFTPILACAQGVATHAVVQPGDTLTITAPPKLPTVHDTVTLRITDTLWRHDTTIVTRTVVDTLYLPPVVVKPPPTPVDTPPVVVGATNEPSGMTVAINTGHISASNTVIANGQVKIGPTVFNNFSPTAMNAQGEAAGNLSLGPNGGLVISYLKSLSGGYSPVRFGVSIAKPGTGYFYLREVDTFSNFAAPSSNNGIKMWEPRTNMAGSGSGPGENDGIGTRGNSSDSTNNGAYVFQQGPNGQFRNLTPTKYVNVTDGKPHTLEFLFTPETSSGAGNGTESMWVDGVQTAHYTDVKWIGPGETPGFPYLLCDPTFGGAQAYQHPRGFTRMIDQLYVSTK